MFRSALQHHKRRHSTAKIGGSGNNNNSQSTAKMGGSGNNSESGDSAPPTPGKPHCCFYYLMLM